MFRSKTGRTTHLKNGDLAQRAVCLVVGAQKLVKDRDVTRAGDWLREAGALVKRSDANESAASITLGIVSTYGRFDIQAAVEWLVYAVKLMQKTSPASLNNDRAPAQRRISGVTPVSDYTLNTTGFSLQSAIDVFKPEQFEQVFYTLNDIAPQEARGIAVLTLCSNFLSHEKQQKPY